jgi:hypothetical protein
MRVPGWVTMLAPGFVGTPVLIRRHIQTHTQNQTHIQT